MRERVETRLARILTGFQMFPDLDGIGEITPRAIISHEPIYVLRSLAEGELDEAHRLWQLRQCYRFLDGELGPAAEIEVPRECIDAWRKQWGGGADIHNWGPYRLSKKEDGEFRVLDSDDSAWHPWNFRAAVDEAAARLLLDSNTMEAVRQARAEDDRQEESPASASGTLTVYANGEPIEIPITAGDTPAMIRANAIAAGVPEQYLPAITAVPAQERWGTFVIGANRNRVLLDPDARFAIGEFVSPNERGQLRPARGDDSTLMILGCVMSLDDKGEPVIYPMASASSPAPSAAPSQATLRRALERVLGRRLTGSVAFDSVRPREYDADTILLALTLDEALQSAATADYEILGDVDCVTVRRTVWESALREAQAEHEMEQAMVRAVNQPRRDAAAEEARETARNIASAINAPLRPMTNAEVAEAEANGVNVLAWQSDGTVRRIQPGDRVIRPARPIPTSVAGDRVTPEERAEIERIQATRRTPAQRQAEMEAEQAQKQDAPMAETPPGDRDWSLLMIDPDLPGEAEARQRRITEELERIERLRQKREVRPREVQAREEPQPEPDRFALIEVDPSPVSQKREPIDVYTIPPLFQAMVRAMGERGQN